jgi:cytochrome c551/c552
MIKQKEWSFKIFGVSHPVASIALTVMALVVPLAVLTSEAEAQGGQDGQALFQRRCSGCHALDADHEGPRLRGVVGRAAGSVKTFQYSEALKNAKHIGRVHTQDSNRWGVILAGGDGKRLLPLTRTITGDDRPKQFCALTGGETLLKQTRRRVGRMILGQQTLLVMTRTHERYYADQVTGVTRLVPAHPAAQSRNCAGHRL